MSDKVYYNSACPVCKAGIEKQRSLMENCGIKDIDWVDVHTQPETATETPSSLEQIRERLHIKDESGQIRIGADAFIFLWLRTPKLRWLGKISQFPVIKPIFQLSYNLFAKLLYRWNRSLKHW
ncbi:MAG: DUF393 domain-containing protein [Nitrosomonas sp.]|nr:DUF393 domain-containing protein [Nitrosomonas sp.]